MASKTMRKARSLARTLIRQQRKARKQDLGAGWVIGSLVGAVVARRVMTRRFDTVLGAVIGGTIGLLAAQSMKKLGK